MVYETEEEQNRKIEALRDKRRLREQSDLRKVLDMREGRRLIWKILSLSGVFAQSFVTPSLDLGGESHCLTNFNEGKRSVGNLIYKDIPPEVELAMKREAANDKLLQDMELKETQKNG